MLDGFVADILAHPADLGIPLVMADWLDEQDDPRAGLVRLFVDLLKTPYPDKDRLWEQAKIAKMQEMVLYRPLPLSGYRCGVYQGINSLGRLLGLAGMRWLLHNPYLPGMRPSSLVCASQCGPISFWTACWLYACHIRTLAVDHARLHFPHDPIYVWASWRCMRGSAFGTGLHGFFFAESRMEMVNTMPDYGRTASTVRRAARLMSLHFIKAFQELDPWSKALAVYRWHRGRKPCRT